MEKLGIVPKWAVGEDINDTFLAIALFESLPYARVFRDHLEEIDPEKRYSIVKFD
jgi:hypothetical protein